MQAHDRTEEIIDNVARWKYLPINQVQKIMKNFKKAPKEQSEIDTIQVVAVR